MRKSSNSLFPNDDSVDSQIVRSGVAMNFLPVLRRFSGSRPKEGNDVGSTELQLLRCRWREMHITKFRNASYHILTRCVCVGIIGAH